MRSLVFPVLGLGLMAIGSVFADADFKVEERKEFSMERQAGSEGVLEVENTNGAVAVVGISDGNRIRITGEKIANGRSQSDAAAALEQIEVQVVETARGLAVKTVVPERGPTNYSVTYSIEVPRGWGVRVANSNGNVSIGGTRGSATATVANGSVRLDDIVGNMHVKVANGGITSSGQIPASGSCKIQTSNGAINAKLVMEASASCDLKTTNGAIKLSLPSTTSAGVSAKTAMGKISVQGLEFVNKTKDQKMIGGETFSGTLGSGSGKVELAVTNGAIALKGF